jgi:hypothetical protein
MNNKRINLVIIDQVWQTSAEPCLYGASMTTVAVVAVVVAAAPVGMECLAVVSMSNNATC